MRASTEENVAVIDKLVLNQNDQLQIYRLTRQILQPAVVWIIFFTAIWLEEETPAEDLTEVIRHARRRCSNSR